MTGDEITMRKKIVGLSLKNYINSLEKTRELMTTLNQRCGTEAQVEQFLFPSLGTISVAKEVLDKSSIQYGAQNISPYANGAYTGEYSIETLIDYGGKFVEIGHNERKTIFLETDEMIHKKIELTLNYGLIPVVCIGEGNKKYETAVFYQLMKDQMTNYFHSIEEKSLKQVILAYEPGWAIGQAQAAKGEYIHQAHQMIRSILAELFGEEVTEEIRIIYGGSVSKDNAKEIINHPDVDGLFLGRFGHEPQNYQKILSIVKENESEG